MNSHVRNHFVSAKRASRMLGIRGCCSVLASFGYAAITQRRLTSGQTGGLMV
jgi:hypothetical protein